MSCARTQHNESDKPELELRPLKRFIDFSGSCARVHPRVKKKGRDKRNAETNITKILKQLTWNS